MQYGKTKQKIFDTAVELFSEKGYDSVSMREIAAQIGISETAIYNHFVNKEAILNDIFDKFGTKLQSYLLRKEQVDKFIETDTTRQLLERCIGRFVEDDSPFMTHAYRITYQEHLTNKTASELVLSQLHDATAKSIRYVLDSLIARERIPAFDTSFYSLLWAQSMFSGAVIWLSHYFNGFPKEMSAAEYNAVSDRLVDMAMNGQIPRNSNFFAHDIGKR